MWTQWNDLDDKIEQARKKNKKKKNKMSWWSMELFEQKHFAASETKFENTFLWKLVGKFMLVGKFHTQSLWLSRSPSPAHEHFDT